MTEFTDEQLKYWADFPEFLSPTLSQLAAEVIRLRAENARLREGLTNIDALSPSREVLNMMHPGAMLRLVLRIGNVARAALKGGEI